MPLLTTSMKFSIELSYQQAIKMIHISTLISIALISHNILILVQNIGRRMDVVTVFILRNTFSSLGSGELILFLESIFIFILDTQGNLCTQPPSQRYTYYQSSIDIKETSNLSKTISHNNYYLSMKQTFHLGIFQTWPEDFFRFSL